MGNILETLRDRLTGQDKERQQREIEESVGSYLLRIVEGEESYREIKDEIEKNPDQKRAKKVLSGLHQFFILGRLTAEGEQRVKELKEKANLPREQ